MLIKIIRTKGNSFFGVSDFYSLKLLTPLRLNFSHLNEHKFRRNFNDTINSMCNCSAATETTIHSLLCYRLHSAQRAELLDGLHKLHSTLQNSSEDQLLTVLLYSSEKYALSVNKEIIRLNINFLKGSESFVKPLFWPTTFVFIHLFTYLCIHLFIFIFIFDVWLYRAYCKRLYLTRVLRLVSSIVLSIIFIFVVLLLVL